jgi:hypothetical protein
MTTTQNTITINVVNDGTGPKAEGTFVTNREIAPSALDDERFLLLYVRFGDLIDSHTAPVIVLDSVESPFALNLEEIKKSVRAARREAREAQKK